MFALFDKMANIMNTKKKKKRMKTQSNSNHHKQIISECDDDNTNKNLTFNFDVHLCISNSYVSLCQEQRTHNTCVCVSMQ